MTLHSREILTSKYRPLIAMLMLLILSSSLIAMANSQNDTQNSVKSMPSNAEAKVNQPLTISTSSLSSSTVSMSTHATLMTDNVEPVPTVVCGETSRMVDECFKNLPPHLMEFLQTTKIVINEQEIAEKCKVFTHGMSCFDDYMMRCLPHEKRNILNDNVEGARKFFQKFCDDRDFQSDYLKNKECFTYIQDDWERCTKTFQDILSEELHAQQKNATHKFLEFCCARHGYEECIYKAARYKCYKHSAKYARETAKTLSEEKHFSNCRQYERLICNGASRRGEIKPSVQFILSATSVLVGICAVKLMAVGAFLSF